MSVPESSTARTDRSEQRSVARQGERIVLEIAVDSVADAVAAIDAGADRIELCERLDLDGVTPPAGLVTAIRHARPLASIAAMLCPVARRYRFDAGELGAACETARDLLAAGADSIVLGAVTEDGREIDEAGCVEIAEAIRGAGGTAVFHRVIDTVARPREALERLAALGFARVLTSGGRGWINATSEEGMAGLAEMAAAARGRIAVLAGGGVRSGNVMELIRRTGVREVHSSARVSGMMSAGEVTELRKALDGVAPEAPSR